MVLSQFVQANQSFFTRAIIRFYEEHGRKSLPWQNDCTPYRVWVSEIMLQQTQVKTAIPYYARFLSRFDDLQILAVAHIDEVLFLWSGLGYYSRARNLHRTARVISHQFSGEFPDNETQLQALPGIGRSTAGAILSQAFEVPSVILDGNVKRLLARFFAISESIDSQKTLNSLWQLAESLLPNHSASFYTRGLMDLGAVVCTKSNPQCHICPLHLRCLGYQTKQQNSLPVRTRKKAKPLRKIDFVLLHSGFSHVLMKKRNDRGIWGGLWCLPELEDLEGEIIQMGWALGPEWMKFQHTFTHFHLDGRVLEATIGTLIQLPQGWMWYNVNDFPEIGLSAPMIKILDAWRHQCDREKPLQRVSEPVFDYEAQNASLNKKSSSFAKFLLRSKAEPLRER